MVRTRYILLDIGRFANDPKTMRHRLMIIRRNNMPHLIRERHSALPDVLTSKWDNEDFKVYRDAFPEDQAESPEKLEAYITDLTKRDVKIASLKNLQGYLWENGYKTGAYSTPLFPDVAPKLKQWKKDGFELAIYSSGSVFAQKLLFGHVNVGPRQKRKRPAGDKGNGGDERFEPPRKKRNETVKGPISLDKNMTTQHQHTDVTKESDEVGAIEDLQYLITDWFDTTNAGLKTEAASYDKIANILKCPPESFLFLSDNVKELDAAAAAGMASVMVDRPGNAPMSDEDKNRLRVVNSFDDIDLNQGGTTSKAARTPSAKAGSRRSQRLKAKVEEAR